MTERLGSLCPVRVDALGAWHPALLEFLRRDAAGSRFMVDEDKGTTALWTALFRTEVLRAADEFTAVLLPILAQRRRAVSHG